VYFGFNAGMLAGWLCDDSGCAWDMIGEAVNAASQRRTKSAFGKWGE
jgi:hypothetical protein